MLVIHNSTYRQIDVSAVWENNFLFCINWS